MSEYTSFLCLSGSSCHASMHSPITMHCALPPSSTCKHVHLPGMPDFLATPKISSKLPSLSSSLLPPLGDVGGGDRGPVRSPRAPPAPEPDQPAVPASGHSGDNDAASEDHSGILREDGHGSRGGRGGWWERGVRAGQKNERIKSTAGLGFRVSQKCSMV